MTASRRQRLFRLPRPPAARRSFRQRAQDPGAQDSAAEEVAAGGTVIGHFPAGAMADTVRAVARAAPESLTVARHRAQPAAAYITRLTVTAVFAYVVARMLPGGSGSVLAPLTALIVVQVTMYQTIRSAIQRVASVVAGVLVALAVSAVTGLTWWSLAILIAAGLAIGQLLRLGQHILEVPISAMLILSLGGHSAAAGRIIETLVGAGAGMLGGLVLTPLRVQRAEDAIDELSRDLASVLSQLAADVRAGSIGDTADERLAQARALAGEIRRVDHALGEAEDSLRLNPRARLLPHARFALRDGLETLEHAAVTVRGIARSLSDGFRPDIGSLSNAEARECLAAALQQLAAAVRAFGRLVRADIAAGQGRLGGREPVEAELSRQLSEAKQIQEHLTGLLRADPPARPPTGSAGWPLRGELLTHLDRLRNELEVEHRARARERWPRPRNPWRQLRQRALPLFRASR